MALQTNVLEFRVSGRLDGVTPNQPFARADAMFGRADPPDGDPDNIYVFEVENLGIIDLSFPGDGSRPDGPVTLGNRYVPWFFLNTDGVAGGVDAGVRLAAFREQDGPPITQKQFQSLSGLDQLYSRQCMFVPHGSALQLSGDIQANPGSPIVVRFAVLLPTTPEEEALIAQACCCLEGIGITVPVPECDPPVVTGINPTALGVLVGPQPLSVFGSGFTNTDIVEILQSGGPAVVNVLTTTFINDTQLDLTVDTGTADAGLYDIFVRRETPPDCFGVLEAGLTLVVPG